MALRSCSSCDGFLPEDGARCPHCGAAAPHASAAVGKAAVALSMVTLMACYGAAPGYMRGPEPRSNEYCASPVDRDGDGFFVCGQGEGAVPRERDCDDANPQVFPGAPETPGDGLDQNCDGSDEAASPVEVPAAAGQPSPSNNTNVVAQ